MKGRYKYAAVNSNIQQQNYIPPMDQSQPIQQVPNQPYQNFQNQISEQLPWVSDSVENPPVSHDGTTNPKYFRTTSLYMPNSPETARAAGVPLYLVVQPAIIDDIQVIDRSNSCVQRCQGCQAFLSIYSEVLPGNTEYICGFCDTRNSFSNKDIQNYGQDSDETRCVAYDLRVPTQYVAMPYICPSYCFLIDMTDAAINSGFSQQFLLSMKASLESVPDSFRVSIITITHHVTVFDIVNQEEIVLTDLTNLSVPMPVAPYLGEVRDQVNRIIDYLLARPAPGTNMGNCYGSSLLVVYNCLYQIGGIVFAAVYNKPTSGPHSIPPRNKTEKTTELELLKLHPEEKQRYWREISFRLSRKSISIFMFSCGSDLDLSTCGIPTHLTGGRCFFYDKFDETAAKKINNDLFASMNTNYVNNCSIRLRTSRGIYIKKYHGSFTISSGSILNVPVIDQNFSIGFELNVETTFTAPKCLFQLAMMYTNSEHVRIVRVCSFSIPFTSDINLIRNNIDQGSLLAYLTRSAVTSVFSNGVPHTLQELKKACNDVSKNMINAPSFNYLSHSLAYSNILAITHPISVDGRVSDLSMFRTYSVVDLMLALYPRMFAVDTLYGPLQLVNESFQHGSVFLIHCVNRICIFIKHDVDPEYLVNVFGVVSPSEVTELPTLETEQNSSLHDLIKECYTISRRYIPLEIILDINQVQALLVDVAYQGRSGLEAWRTELMSAQNKN